MTFTSVVQNGGKGRSASGRENVKQRWQPKCGRAECAIYGRGAKGDFLWCRELQLWSCREQAALQAGKVNIYLM